MNVLFEHRRSKWIGFFQLYCRIIAGGAQTNIGLTGITIVDRHWNGREVTQSDTQADFKNEHLGIMHERLLTINNDLIWDKQAITAEKIYRAYWLQGKVHSPMTTVFERYLRDSAADPESKLIPGTVDVYERVRKKLIDFSIHGKALDLPAEDFDVLCTKKFRRWMASVPHKPGTGHAESDIITPS